MILTQQQTDYFNDSDYLPTKYTTGYIPLATGRPRAQRNIPRIYMGFGPSAPRPINKKENKIKTIVTMEVTAEPIIVLSPPGGEPVEIPVDMPVDEIIEIIQEPVITATVDIVSVGTVSDDNASVRTVSEPLKNRKASILNVLCWDKDKCTRSNCRYAHSIKEVKVEPCKYKARCHRVVDMRRRYINNPAIKEMCFKLHPGETVMVFLDRTMKK